MKSKYLIVMAFLLASCGSEPKKGRTSSPPAKPQPTPTATPEPTPPPPTPAPVAPPPPPPVAPQGDPRLAQGECPDGPVRRWFYNVFHKEDCPPPATN